MIHVVDYGLGNVQAILNIYKRMGFDAIRAKTSTDLVGAVKIILPGVGSFDYAMKLLNQSGMRETLESLVLKDKVPILGICVGMQILASSSDEGTSSGLGWIPGRILSFRGNKKSANLPLPHMGWNNIQPKLDHPLFEGIDSDALFYFLHSFYFECDNNVNETSTVFYGVDLTCSVSMGNIHGVQFHPEKSHHLGAQLLKNFVEY